MMLREKRLWALFLSAAMIVTQIPAVAMAENNVPEDGSIASFAALDSSVAAQTVDVGTELSGLNLPDTVIAEVYHVTEDTAIPDEDDMEEENSTSTASPSNAGESVPGRNGGEPSKKGSEKTGTTVITSTEEIAVTWDSEPAYDGDRPGKYVFTADVGGYVLSNSANLPQITVTVSEGTVGNPTENPTGEPLPCPKTEGCTLADGHEGGCVPAPPENGLLVKTVTDWTFVDDDLLTGNELTIPNVSVGHQADFDTVVAMLPTQISAEFDGGAEPDILDITGWNCPEYKQDNEGNWPLTGEYTFTASLPEGYACVPLPAVKIVLPENPVNLFGLNNTITQGGLTVKASDNGEVEYTEGSGFTLGTSGSYEISGTWIGTLTGVDINNQKAIITVPSSVTANVTLSDVKIDVSGTDSACAFVVDGTANITLFGTNTLTSGNSRAGLEVPENATITIDGDGSLAAQGGLSGAGIGGNGWFFSNCGTIEINGGTVNAKGGWFGAGIGGGGGGGGDAGSGGTIIITNGTITAEGGLRGAGIGGGGKMNGYSGIAGDGGSVTIEGGTVYAYGGTGNGFYSGGAGIGGGGNSKTDDEGMIGGGGIVKISGEYTRVIATGREDGYDIGGGSGRTANGSGSSGSLSVTDRATLEMKDTGTNVADPDYRDCTIIRNGSLTKYNSSGRPIASPELELRVSPADSVTLPNSVTLTARLWYASPDDSGKKITFTVGTATYTADTNNFGRAVYTFPDLSPGTYTFGASYEGDEDNDPAKAVEITGYTVKLGTQRALTLNGLGSAYTYGCDPFKLSTSGGDGSGAVSYVSSDSSVAKVTGDTVTIQKAGTFTITAIKAADSSYAEATVKSPGVTVIEAAPNVSLAAAGGSTTSEALILTATVSKAGAGAVPAGTVTFKQENTPLGTVTLDGSGQASHTISSPAAGSHKYTVEYSGQTGYYKAASASRTIGVGLTDQTGFAITDPGTKTYGDSDFTLTTTGGQGTGSVSFSAPPGNGVLTVETGGAAKITGAGKVTVTAAKDADSTYNQTTATLEITVTPRNISHVTVNVSGNHVYTSSQLQPVFEVTDGAIAIAAGDYTNSYGPNIDAGTGTGSITLTGQRNYTGTKTVNFDIGRRPLDNAAITLESGSYMHTGSEIKPAVTNVVVDNITVLPIEYDVGYADNINEGTATVIITAKPDSNFSGSASATFEITKSVRPSGSSDSSYSDPEPQDTYIVAGDRISQSVPRSNLKKLADSGKSLTLRCDKAGMVFDPAALNAILAAVPSTVGNITFAASPADLSAFPDTADLIGARPVYNFTIGYKDSKGNPAVVPVDFPAGSASITLNYAPTAGETAGSLFTVFVDRDGSVTWLDKSSYEGGRMLADVPHFSAYGVAYKASAPVFIDITGHWAKEDIEFAAARGLLSGTGNGLFSPDGALTRGMFVTALGRLAGINPDSYQTRSFTDVNTDAYYAPYAEWASHKDIAGGTGDHLFSPDAPVTREQMAVMVVNYARQMGYSLPSPITAATFADSGTISTWAAKEVTVMQQAGIVRAKDGNRFDPQGNTTRAEGSAVLRRFIEVVIDPATVTGWIKNDSGHWLYYKGGTALTGWQTIGNLRYFFNADGLMYEGWKQDTSTGKWYYWTNAGAATDWMQIGGKWYYFDENGGMAANTVIDGYEVGPDGERKEES